MHDVAVALVGVAGALVGVVLAYLLTRTGRRYDVGERRNLDLVRMETTVNQLAHDVAELKEDTKDLASKVAGAMALLSAFVKVTPRDER